MAEYVLIQVVLAAQPVDLCFGGIDILISVDQPIVAIENLYFATSVIVNEFHGYSPMLVQLNTITFFITCNNFFYVNY